MKILIGVISVVFPLSLAVAEQQRIIQPEREVIQEIIPRDIHGIPDGFPRYLVPEFEHELNTVRQVFYHHYLFYPNATFYDVYKIKGLAWADTGVDRRYAEYKRGMRHLLSSRIMDAEGYVSSMQHIGLAHPEGWPFPLWIQSQGMGWHFGKDHPVWTQCGTERLEDVEGWGLDGIRSEGIHPERGLQLKITSDDASLTTPGFEVSGLVSPFFVLHWRIESLSNEIIFSLDWKSEKYPEYSSKRRVYFSVDSNDDLISSAVPLYKILSQDDVLTQVRLNIQNAKGLQVAIERMFTSVDSRHRINNFVWLQGSDDYLRWTGDLNFLRSQINRWRLALRYAIDEFGVEEYHCVNTPWVNHDGRPGRGFDEDGNRVVYYGQGMGGGYFDLMPHGGKDAAATLLLYDTLKRMANLEEQIARHPQWNIPGGPLAFDLAYLQDLAEGVKKKTQDIFWNPEHQRFVLGLDRDGKFYDYGWVYHNLETMYYGLADPQQIKTIYAWINGERRIEGDTSQGDDIYHWRFAPRTTTKRNVSYCLYSWDPLYFEWGDQVQDGGAVFAWSYYDLMNRIKYFGPDNAWQRLQEIIVWFNEVQSRGGYRKYYEETGIGTLQGGGTAGGLGLDSEFMENIMVPQVMIYGFMGLNPRLDGIEINPQLPSDWPELTVTSIRWHGRLLDITAKDKTVLVTVRQGQAEDANFTVPPGWTLRVQNKEDFNVDKDEQ